uniref:Putative galactose binding protein n=1 Tax=Dugesia japonica TaxID=6161 RepID=A0A1L7NSH5_DUGJA|nr:putative galactose binding protein [Dugesia japonica]
MDRKNNDKNDTNKKSYNSTKTGISTLLSDTTHLHNQHLYDINCKICNGASKSNTNKKATEKDNPIKKPEEKHPFKEKNKSISETDNIIPPIESCSPESLVTSWFNKSSEVIDLSPINLQNDEFKVTSSVETPDMAIDMELCSTPSASEHVDNQNVSNCKNIDSKVDSSSKIEITPNKLPHIKPVKQKLTSVWEGDIIYKEVGTVICKTYLVSRHQLGKSKEDIPMKTTGDKLREEINLSVHFGNQIKINGRSKLSVIQDYLTKLRKHSNKTLNQKNNRIPFPIVTYHYQQI